METLNAINERRSIRIFKKDAVPDELIQKLLEAAVMAPSGENRQPWRFVVLQNDKKNEFVQLLTDVYQKLNEKGIKTGTFKRTIGCIRRANVFILVFNAYSGNKDICKDNDSFKWLVDIQSIGGAIQTILLMANELALGSLWVCDVFYAAQEICSWLKREDELVGGVCLGYADESPNLRPRMQWNEVTIWPDKCSE